MKRRLTESNAQIRDLYEAGVRPVYIAKHVHMAVKTVNNRISVMRKSGRIKRKTAGTALGMLDHHAEPATIPSLIINKAPEPETALRDRLLSERLMHQAKVDAIDRLLQVL